MIIDETEETDNYEGVEKSAPLLCPEIRKERRMKEEKLRNGTEEIKQEHEDKNAAGENQSGDVIDLAEDEWRDLGEDKPLGNIYTWIDTHINRLSVLLPIVSAALLILILLIIGLSGKKMDTPKVEESYVSSTPRLEKETEEKKQNLRK